MADDKGIEMNTITNQPDHEKLITKPLQSEKTSKSPSLKTKINQKWRSWFMCDVCNARFSTKPQLTNHSSTHNHQPYKCQRCSQAFRSKNEWISHQTLHPMSPIINTYTCANCNKMCFNFTLLKNHVKRCVNYHSEVCLICLQIFPNYQTLNFHVQTHVDDEISFLKPLIHSKFKCKFCHWDFWNRSDVSSHGILKKQGIMFKCSLCSARFCLRYHLDEHMMWHKKNEPFKCKFCIATFFSSKIDLKNHLQTHDVLRPYQCQFCPNCFLLPSSRQIHVQMIHFDVKNVKKREETHKQDGGECELLKLVRETIDIAESDEEIDLDLDVDVKEENGGVVLNDDKTSDLSDFELEPVIKQPRVTYSRKRLNTKSISIDFESLEDNFNRILVKILGDDLVTQLGLNFDRDCRDVLRDFLICAGLKVSEGFEDNLYRFIDFVMAKDFDGNDDDDLLRERKMDQLVSEMIFCFS